MIVDVEAAPLLIFEPWCCVSMLKAVSVFMFWSWWCHQWWCNQTCWHDIMMMSSDMLAWYHDDVIRYDIKLLLTWDTDNWLWNVLYRCGPDLWLLWQRYKWCWGLFFGRGASASLWVFALVATTRPFPTCEHTRMEFVLQHGSVAVWGGGCGMLPWLSRPPPHWC